MREWNIGSGEGSIENCATKKKENERWEKRVQEARTEEKVWEIVRREREKVRGGDRNGRLK